jgi:hypothetical protein
LNPSSNIFDWAFSVDKKEYYLAPSNNDSIGFSCGHEPIVYVRVTAAGGTDSVALGCPGMATTSPIIELGFE